MSESRPPAPTHSVRVPPGSRDTLAVLVRAAAGLSHREAKDAVVAGRVQVDGDTVFDPVMRPRGGAKVDLFPHGVPRARRPVEGPGFRVVHLDDAFVVVDKDPGIVTIPTSEDTDPNDLPLVARVIAALGLAGHPVQRGLWVVHRIDRSTSGLVLFARTEADSDALRTQFRARRPLREYIAWTEGVPEPAEGTLRHVLVDDERSRRVFTTRDPEGGKDAELLYRVEASRSEPPRSARVRVRLVTGRRNQVRVQFSASGWPLLGDRFYGAKEEGPGRTALHAARLGFEHPRTGAELVFESPVPRDLERLDRRLFGYTPPPRKKRPQ